MKTQGYDLIGDIHGQHGKLVGLLEAMGYQQRGSGLRASWQHPEGRKVIFLGDYIDRGPTIRETLHTVRAMVDAGEALAIMGNHEYNAVAAETPDGKGDFLRPEKVNRGGQLETKRQFAGFEAEWEEWKQWMKHLPMYLDLGDLRAVHACWDAAKIASLDGLTIADPDFLVRSATRSTWEYLAVEAVLKGPELRMPEGNLFYDKEGIGRQTVRVRWWDLPAQGRISHVAMPEPFDAPGDFRPEDLKNVANYGKDQPPVFIGHYWLRPTWERQPLTTNIACLDYSAAFGDNALTAYRWNGEPVLTPSGFITAGKPQLRAAA
ncbi:MAG: metallophosphoesterase [Verrucomicrobiaceae bacterium]|nr:metallophosphoesterase [Verrucomicrobiaceae bacterium]